MCLSVHTSGPLLRDLNHLHDGTPRAPKKVMTKTYCVTLPNGRKISTRTSNTYTHSVCCFYKWYEHEEPYWGHLHWCGSLPLAEKKARHTTSTYRLFPELQVVILEVEVLER